MSLLLRFPRPSGASVAAVIHLGAVEIILVAMAILLATAYALTGSYGSSIIMVGAAVNTLTTPLAVSAWRSQQARVRLQPDVDRLRRRHANDRPRLASETAALFKEHGVSPFAGCLPALLPAPLYFAMYQVIRGLTHRAPGSAQFRPRYVPHSSRLFHSLATHTTMNFWGVDLARSGAAALQISALSAGVFAALLAVTVAAGIWQQHLARPPAPPLGQSAPPAMPRAALFVPALFAIWGLALPLAVTLYYTTASLVRLAQQAMILKAHPW
jgi:YidC/Oxa1 family membrane protein insertase